MSSDHPVATTITGVVAALVRVVVVSDLIGAGRDTVDLGGQAGVLVQVRLDRGEQSR